jgi:hypothetical protein
VALNLGCTNLVPSGTAKRTWRLKSSVKDEWAVNVREANVLHGTL